MFKRILLLVLSAFILFSCQPDRPLSTAKEITAFSFPAAVNPGLGADITGTISGTTITATVPFGTNLTALKASFTTTGVSVVVSGAEQTSGMTVNDFTNALTYTVTAEDGSTQNYLVTVNIPVTIEQLKQMIGRGEDVTRVDTSGITDMSYLFFRSGTFNQDISGWDTSNVTDMHYMFSFAEAFNQDISGWNTANVTNMKAMFQHAASFNQSIGSWDVSKITNMEFMFYDAEAFNQDISSWSDHVEENIEHTCFSSGSCPLTLEYHPYANWN